MYRALPSIFFTCLGLCFLSIPLSSLAAEITEDQTQSPQSVEAETKISKIGLDLSYSLSNTMGMSNFYGRPSWLHNMSLSASYALTEHERVSGQMGFAAEFFSRTNGNQEHAFLLDPSLSVSTSRIPSITPFKGAKLSWSPNFSVMLPLSSASRNVDPYYFSFSSSLATTLSWQGLSLSLSPGISYSFYAQVQRAVITDSSEDGALKQPFSLSIPVALSYSLKDFSAATSYTFIKGRTYANTQGNAYWRDYSVFSVSAGYKIHALANVTVGYQYGVNPLDALGKARLPFWSSYADWYNRGKFFLSVSGTYSL